MEKWKRELAVLWLGVILSSISYTMLIPFLPLYLLDLGASPESVNLWSGLIFSATFFIGAIMAPYWGAMADKYGSRKMVIRAGFSLAVVYLLGAFVSNPYELLGMRILQGFASGFVPASMILIASSAPKDQIGWSLGIIQTASAAGGILGPLFGGLGAHFFSISSSFILASVLIFLGTLAVCFLVREMEPSKAKEESNIFNDFKVVRTNKHLLLMLVIMMLTQNTIMIRQPIIALYVNHLAGEMQGAVLYSGIIFSLTGLAGIIAAPYWGSIGQRKGFYKILIISLLGAGAVNIMHLFIGSLWQFGLLQFIFGIFLAGALPAINTIVVQNTDFSFRGRAMGLTTTANQLGQMSGPLLGGIISSWFSFELIFFFAGMVLLTAGWGTWKTANSDDGKTKGLT